MKKTVNAIARLGKRKTKVGIPWRGLGGLGEKDEGIKYKLVGTE